MKNRSVIHLHNEKTHFCTSIQCKYITANGTTIESCQRYRALKKNELYGDNTNFATYKQISGAGASSLLHMDAEDSEEDLEKHL